MNASNHQPSVTIKQWEDAGASLVAALGNYMDLCLKLTPSSLGEGINPKNVAIRIDPTVKAIFKEITEIGSTLARTRNRLVSPLLQLPEEIISIIFTHYVFDRMIPDPSRPSSLAQEVWHIHYGLDTLIHVCSSWRNFLIAKGRFWSIIPVLTGSSTSEWSPLECSLQRAGGCKLYLAVDDGNWEISKLLLAVLSEHSSRFRSINLNIRDHHVIRDALIKMLHQGTTRSLTELSIRWSTALDASPSLPSDPAYILPREHPQQALFGDMVGALTAFRISGISFHWDTMVFSTRLVELRIDSVTLGYDDAIIPFLHTLSLASGLRDLNIISVATFRRPGVAPDRGALSIEFPNLQSLLLQDLYLNTLKFLLPIFAPARHCLTLYLTGLCLKVNMVESDGIDGGQAQQSELDRVAVLCAILKPLSLDTLTIGEHKTSVRVWLEGAAFHMLLGRLPTLRTLKLHNWIFEARAWKDLTRPQAAQENPQEHPFATLENLYMGSARIRTRHLGVVQDMVVSLPLRRFVLQGIAQTLTSVRTYEQSLEGSELVEWLRDNVPEFHLVDDEHYLPEFDSVRWRLW